MTKILKINNIEKYYGSKGKSNITKALDNVSLEVNKGEFVGIMGASGSGKTTLLNCISTIDKVSAGNIIINDKDINQINDKDIAKFRRENLGFIFQDFNLLDTLTIEENIALALTINRTDVGDVDDRVKKIAKELGIFEILKKFPYEISGGQKQRCACARALINNPKLILADEPTGALDSKSAKMLLETIRKMNEDLDATILVVTHDPFSASYSKRILFFQDGKIFNELNRGAKTRQQFYHEIIDVLSLVGGDADANEIS
ncbi:ABC transporter ATP-binding protein [Serpentinicella sp. ANB-PHB4]|uniref:ABC transporter ATP-binding protein n=1 Tax=Serpentinicella sp. ANB-PHB4 TaxID=3074076 RepID=UPI00285D5AD0|nr:ABC transporter ATP-binding protein [Serpentinicella sp. ANB-PHB4]MDR5658963.1 ABC transporter ATP-binding protein [Serpentinicella sp. ANB-PHB4]